MNIICTVLYCFDGMTVFVVSSLIYFSAYKCFMFSGESLEEETDWNKDGSS